MKTLLFARHLSVTLLCALSIPGATQAETVPPWLGDLLSSEQVADTWTERSGHGTNQVAIERVKTISPTGRGRVLSYGPQGKALADADLLALRASAFPSRIHPDLLARFSAGVSKAGGEPTQAVVVWFSLPKARDNAIRALWDRAAEPDEFTEPDLADSDPAVAVQRLQAVKAAEAKLAASRAAVATRYTAEADAFIAKAGIPAARVIHRYNYAPAISANLTLGECQALAASGAVNYIFPNRTATKELDVIIPAMRGYAGQQARYNGSGVTIGHVEPPDGLMVSNNPYLALSGTFWPGGAVDAHASAIGGIIRSTHSKYRGMSRGCNLLSVNPSNDTQVAIDASVDWALARGATILNMSYGINGSADGALDWSDIYFDYMVHNARVLFTKSAGNEGTGTGVVTSPGRGYNSLTVGNVMDNGTTAWTDDAMHVTSSYVDSETGGDKPEVCAYGTAVYTTTIVSPWVGDRGYGTSYAAPLVAAIAGLIVDSYATHADEPWVLKAMLMASAAGHNIEGTGKLSDKDGAGKALATATRAGTAVATLTPASFNTNQEYEIAWNITLKGGETNRIVMSYTHEPASESATPEPGSYDRCDLDLYLYVGGTQVAYSAYGSQNAFEIIDYKPATNVTGRIRIRNFLWDPDVASVRLGVAAVAVSTLGSGPDPIDDNYEQNDTRPTAADPRSNGGAWENTWLQSITGLAVQADADWYKIDVTPNFNLINVDCRFFHADGNINIALYNSAGGIEATSAGTTNNEYLSTLVAATGGTYYINVYGANATNTYDLWWDDIEPGPPAVPTNVVASPGLGCGVANLSWRAVDGVIGYRIHYEESASHPPFTPVDNGTPLNGSFVGNVTSVVISNLAPTTTYYFAVTATNSGGTSTYSTVVSTRTGACEDNYEQNDSRSTAADPRHNGGNWELLSLSAISNRGAQYDADYYEIAITPGYEHIVATCSFVHAEGDVDLFLVNTAGTIIASSVGVVDGESIDYNVGGGTNYYLLIAGDNQGNVYDLRWDDALRYVPLPPATVTGTIGAACGRVTLSWNSSSNTSGYRIFYDEDSANPPFSVTDDGTPPSGSTVGSNVTSVTISNLGSGTYYYFAVQATNSFGASDYSMQFRLRASACEDAYEENDVRTSAATPGGGSWKNQWISGIAGRGVNYDFDFFRIDVTSGYERVLARCTFEHDEGDLFLNLYNSNGTLVVSSGGTTDVESIDRIVSAPGPYYLRVDGGGGGNVYDLWWNDAPRILAPSYVNAVGGTNCGEIRFSWSRASNATGYVVWYDEDSGNPPYTPMMLGAPTSGASVGNVTNVTITGLDGGGTYYLAVQSRDALGSSAYSGEGLAVAGVCPPICLGAAMDTAAPTNFVLKWQSDPFEFYDIVRAVGTPSNFLPYVTDIASTWPTNSYPLPFGPSNVMFYRVEQQ